MKSANAIPALISAYSDKKCSISDCAIYGKALFIIKEDLKYLTAIIDLLQDIENTDWNDRQMAITLLIDVKHPEVFAALERALYDPEYLVRSFAATIYFHNSCRKTSDQTILNNIESFDKKKLDKLARLLRNKIYT